MTRILSGAVLIGLAVAVVWFASPALFLAVAEAVLILAFLEYARLTETAGLPVPRVVAGAAAMLVSLGIATTEWGGGPGRPVVTLDAVLMTAFVALSAVTLTTWRGDRTAVARVGAAMFPSWYLGLPIGAMVSIRARHGPPVLFLLMLTVIVSDTAQYYTGRLMGRTPLAPMISPKKTVEGAIGGLVFGSLTLAAAGAWWLPMMPVFVRVMLGLTVVCLGIAGDLFESMLKRSADVKDSSGLIPGHGGVLDRIDALLFAAPIYYVVLKYV